MATFTRITKREARKLFAERKTFAVCPHKLRPGFPFAPQSYPSAAEWIESKGGDVTAAFDSMLANWAYYNASHETGYYPSFYLERS